MALGLSMADGNITVEVSTQAAQAELARLRAENARLAREAHEWWTACANATKEIEWLTQEQRKLRELREKVGMAYGYLWCVNNEPCAPDYMPPDRMAYEARKLLRDTMTDEERGTYINRVLPLVRGVGA